MDRTSLRNRLLERRKHFDRAGLEHAGKRIADQVTGTRWYRESTVIHCFSGATDKGEISTESLLEAIIRSGKRLVMPRMGSAAGEMEHYLVRETSSLETNKWGIKEPQDGPTVSPSELDLILVPGLAVDLSGNRIGYGKGYYDRFLGAARAKTIILIPEAFILDEIPAEAHDVPVDAIATENRLINCKRNI